jgi:L-lactate utilization protein LutC
MGSNVGEFSKVYTSDPEKLERQVSALLEVLAHICGSDKLVLKAGKLEALGLLKSQNLEDKVIALQRIVFEDPTLDELPEGKDIDTIITEIENEVAEILARREVEERLERRVAQRMQQKHEEYVREVKMQMIKEDSVPDNAHTLKKYAELEKLERRKLSKSALELIRPNKLSQVIGQESKTDEEGTGSKSNSPLPDIPVATSDIRYFAGQSPSVGGNPVELLGAAVFRGDKMVGEITGEEVRQVLLLKGTFKQGIAVVRDSEAHDRFIAADLRLARPTQTRVTRDGDRFKIKVDVRLEGGLVGSQERGDYFDPKVLQAVETKLASEIQKGCRDIVRKAQTEFSSDIFGFGNKARHLTMTWKEWQDLNWNSEFPDADVEVSVQVELRRTGLLFRSPQPSAD